MSLYFQDFVLYKLYPIIWFPFWDVQYYIWEQAKIIWNQLHLCPKRDEGDGEHSWGYGDYHCKKEHSTWRIKRLFRINLQFYFFGLWWHSNAKMLGGGVRVKFTRKVVVLYCSEDNVAQGHHFYIFEVITYLIFRYLEFWSVCSKLLKKHE